MMLGLTAHQLRAALSCFALLALLSSGGALAQTAPGASAPAPATLRLAQVVPRLPIINFYSIAQDESGMPVAMGSADLSALVGSDRVPVHLSREPDNIGIVFLIDISGSLRPPQYKMIGESVGMWVDSLRPGDRAAIVTLGSSVNTVVDFTANKSVLKDAVARLAFKDQQTLLYQGLIQAIDLSKRLDKNLPLRRAIVVLTDGMDDQQGGAGRQEVLDKLAIDPTPIYGIGASAEKSPRVDQALKEFAGLVRTSGGDYRRVEVTTLNRGFTELQNIVNSTQHLTSHCDLCLPDGSAIVVRLFMSEGSASLSSGSVTVRAVGSEGQIVLAPKPNPNDRPSDIQNRSWWAAMRELILNYWRWLVLAALALAGTIGAFWVIPPRRDITEETHVIPPSVPTQPSNPSIIEISLPKKVEPGTQQKKRRLRLYPLGHNELQPQEALFEGELTVGRSPESDICIHNDSQVSGSHCTLSPRDGRIFVQDDGSRNGTRVNGVPIEGSMHAEADSMLGVGRTELRMRLLAAGEQ